MSQSLSQLGLDRLSVSERIELIGLIWGGITESGEETPVPDWHLRELEKRRAAADADPGAGIPWDVVESRLMGR